MGGKKKVKVFLQDDVAISEEYTSIPALTVVMVGFTFFLLILANTVTSYEGRIATVHRYQTADIIATKLTNPNCFFIKESGLVDLTTLCTEIELLQAIQQDYRSSGVFFFVRLSWENQTKDFPSSISNITGDRVAVTKNIGIYVNEATTVPGRLTIILGGTRS